MTIASYHSTCPVCGDAIEPGDRIAWARLTTGEHIVHRRCKKLRAYGAQSDKNYERTHQ